jgi:hypothetical protein
MTAARDDLADLPPAFDDPRLLAAVTEFQADYERGRRPNKRLFLERHPDIAAELRVCLDGLILLHAACDREP